MRDWPRCSRERAKPATSPSETARTSGSRRSGPDGPDRIQRYYMAQGLLPPSVLRLDAIRPLVVVDCADARTGPKVLRRKGLTAVRDFGSGLVLARPES